MLKVPLSGTFLVISIVLHQWFHLSSFPRISILTRWQPG